MMHNTFDIEQDATGFKAISHNFKEVVGSGKSEREAIINMENKIVYLADNDPVQFNKWLDLRRQNRVTCLCGYIAPDVILLDNGRI